MFAPPIAKPKQVAPPVRGVLQRKCACGARTPAGGTCATCADKERGLQRKLAIGSSSDPLEHEADRVADQVMADRSPSYFVGAPMKVQRYAPNQAQQAQEAPPSVDRVLTAPGRPLDAPIRRDMETRFGHDFSQVRVHGDGTAAQSARDVGASAYTAGNHLVFGAAQFQPGSDAGRRLLAHELVHVVQQEGMRTRVQRQSPQATGLGGPGSDLRAVSTPGAGSVATSQQGAQVTGPKTESEPGVCGPEVKTWFVAQVGKAIKDKRVQFVMENILLANTLAIKRGTTAEKLIEFGVTDKIEDKEEELKENKKSPTGERPTKDIKAANKSYPRTSLVFSFGWGEISTIEGYLTTAATKWKELVGPGADYDFKAHTMLGPLATGCVTSNCHNTITICGGLLPENCYLTDVPGNLFYALIGKYVGFSERALQLGSQWAQLGSSGAWDPPKDTNSINLGYSLPLASLTEETLCAVLKPAHNSLNTRENCSDCPLPTTAELK